MSKIEPFSSVVFRQPVYKLSHLVNSITSMESLLSVFNSSEYKMAIITASPALYTELKKWLNGDLKATQAKRMQDTAVKYFERMCTRCTPFGRFSYCSTGKIGSKTRINNEQEMHSVLMYDYHLSQQLCSLYDKSSNNKFFVNPTIHKIADKIHFQKQSHNKEIIDAEVHATDFMQKVLDIAVQTPRISNIVMKLQAEYEIDTDICTAYIIQLHDIGLLISHSSPQTICSSNKNFKADISGIKYIRIVNQITSDFKRLSNVSDADDYLNTLTDIIQTLDSKHLSADMKSIVQTDTFSDSGKNTISETVIKELTDYYSLISSVTPFNRSAYMVKFEKDYMARYEGERHSLVEVLNPISGIGYGHTLSQKSKFINQIKLLPQNKFHNFYLTNFQLNILKKILSDDQSKHQLELNREDFKECIPIENKNMGLSFAAMCKIFSFGEKTIICRPTFNGGSAANLLARFASSDTDINDLVNEILTYEDSQTTNTLCEISYLPSSKSGNILRRMPIRTSYINYICKSTETASEIPINDIFIQIRNGKIELGSFSTGKYIEPRLTSAYNYPKSESATFRFLCDYEYYNTRPGLAFNWGSLNTLLSHFPRVKFESLILTPERWRINTNSFLESEHFSIEKFLEYCDLQYIPSWINLLEGDNTLFVDLNNPISTSAFISTIKARNSFEIEEFIPTDDYRSCDSIAECIIPLKYAL